MVTGPVGLAGVWSSGRSWAGRGTRQTIGGCGGCALDGRTGGSQTPPKPRWLASLAPTKDGGCGVISAMRVGRAARSVASSSRSWSWSTMGGVKVMWLWLWARERATWSWEKRPRPPGRPMAMLRSCPRSCCHCRTVIGMCGALRISVSMVTSLVRRWGGSSMVCRMVSMSQPRTVFRVDQQASPFSVFWLILAHDGQGHHQWGRLAGRPDRCSVVAFAGGG